MAEPEVAPAPAPAPTAEEIAALEQAAFERGIESARAEQQALKSTCEAMDEAIAAWRATTSSLLTANRTQVLDLARELVADWLQAELATEPERYLDRALEGPGRRAVRSSFPRRTSPGSRPCRRRSRLAGWRRRHRSGAR